MLSRRISYWWSVTMYRRFILLFRPKEIDRWIDEAHASGVRTGKMIERNRKRNHG